VDAVLQQKTEAVVCANDITATKVMHGLLERNIRIPEQVLITGIDDVPYAQFLPVPLTTYRQDCAGIGAAAMTVMLDRIAEPAMPARDVRITGELIIRQSSRR
jgi:DNA-binding LacI/PurR family transcriptional regulator